MKNLLRNIERHLHRLCLVPSRHIGSPGAAAAAAYIEETFRSYGYPQTVQEPFPATGWRFGSMIFADLDEGSRDVPGVLPCFFSRSAEVTDTPFWLTEAELEKISGEQVAGRLCVVELLRGGLDVRGRNGVAEDLDALGAAAAVFIGGTDSVNSTLQRSPNLKTLGTVSAGKSGSLHLARNRNHRYFLKIDAETFPHTGHNVVAVRPGTGPFRAVFGAHYDAAPLTQGACDNASGVACLLEAARLLREELPEWTFEFVAFDAEEYCIHGDLPGGSEAYVTSHPDRKWAFFTDFDCVGTLLGEEAVCVGRSEKLPAFDTIYPVKPIRYAGDERNFDRLEVPSLWFTSFPRFQEFHTPADTIDTLDIGKIARCVSYSLDVTRQICLKLQKGKNS